MQNFSEIYKDLLRRIEELESENQSLRNAIQILNTNYETLKAENAILKAENTALKAENTALKIENSTLKEKLGLNSTNSGIPTSKELYKIKKDHHHKSTRHPGGQPGHKGAIREDMIPGEIIEIPITNICSCGGKVILSDPHIHQKIDIPEIKPHVKEYHLQNGHCIKCGKKIAAKLPDEIGYDLFGFRTKAIISALTGFYKNSKRETTKIMNNIFNLKISLGTISNTEKRVSKKCQNTYQQIKDEVTDEKILHLDETSHYNKGKLGWCWMATNNRTSFIKLADSRAMKILTEIIPKYDGTVITDRYAAYNYFPKENRQICLAHLARDFERFANSANIEIRMIGIYLRDMIQELFAIKKAFQTNKISKLIFDRRARKIRKRTLYYLKAITGIPDANRAVGVAKNILKSETMMWKFLEDPDLIPLTNNHAERQIRHYVVYRKNSYFTWSKRGNEFLERIISIYLTWTQRKENPFQYLLLTLDSS